MAKKTPPPQTDAAGTRWRALRPLSFALPTQKHMQAACQKRGFQMHKLMTQWHDIVGEEWCALCVPVKYHLGTLHVRVHPSVVLQFTHARLLFLERIRRVTGASLHVDRLAIQQGNVVPLKRAPRAQPWRPLSVGQQKQLQHETRHITHEPLRRALYRLGEVIFAQAG